MAPLVAAPEEEAAWGNLHSTREGNDCSLKAHGHFYNVHNKFGLHIRGIAHSRKLGTRSFPACTLRGLLPRFITN